MVIILFSAICLQFMKTNVLHLKSYYIPAEPLEGLTKTAFTCSMSGMETPEQCMKSVQSLHQRD